MPEITIDEMIEYFDDIRITDPNFSTYEIEKAILSALQEAKKREGKCDCTDSTGDISIQVCNCCGKPIKGEPFEGQIKFMEEGNEN